MKNDKEENKISIKKLSFVDFFLVGIALLIIGTIGGRYFSYSLKNICSNNFGFLNSDVVCGKKDVISKVGYAPTQDKIENFIKIEKSADRLDKAALYFRDLENGPVWGINENINFTPASLLKLPLALFYMSTAEDEPKLLEQKLSFNKSNETFSQFFAPSEEIVANQSYTIDELLMHMLENSDNNAYELLQAHLDAANMSSLIKETYLEMGIIADGDKYQEDMTVRRYAGMFRGLYNASYFNPNLSNKVLGWLAQSKFKLGLEAGVPEGVKVAHKFGERTYPDGTNQLHDCGIVYYPQNPYLICVMTKGKNYDDLAKVISTISKDIYEEVDSRKITN